MYRGHDVVAAQSYQILLRPQDEINLRRRSGSSKDVTNAQASRVRRPTSGDLTAIPRELRTTM
jgi:hypothetical protein